MCMLPRGVSLPHHAMLDNLWKSVRCVRAWSQSNTMWMHAGIWVMVHVRAVAKIHTFKFKGWTTGAKALVTITQWNQVPKSITNTMVFFGSNGRITPFLTTARMKLRSQLSCKFGSKYTWQVSLVLSCHSFNQKQQAGNVTADSVVLFSVVNIGQGQNSGHAY